MPIETTTVYTKERLLRFQTYLFASKKALWISSAVAAVFIAAYAVLMPHFKPKKFKWKD